MPMLTVSLSPRLAAAVRAAIEEGDYASESEVVRDALDHWCRQNGTPDPTPHPRREADGLCVADLLSAHRARLEPPAAKP